MDTNLKRAILTVLQNYISFLGNDPDTQLQIVSDETNHHYLLVELGWQDGRRIYGTLIHLDIINGKIWIQQDGTEDGIASELVAIGIPKQQIVLGFKSEQRRRITEFALS
ncbi:XisI-like fdxN element excision controlling factor protein [Leptolyngbya sp. NIES-3755]|nr:XisI-like fdxN element excision controlling factor protein [Leptolyngbya sp. NIES-3755]